MHGKAEKMKGRQLLTIIGSVTLINFIARVLGFFREAVAGYQFGTAFQADSIIIAYTIPNLLYITAGGALATAFISVYGKIDDPREQGKYLESFFSWLMVGLILLTTCFLFFSDVVIELLFTGLDTHTAILSERLFQVMAPATFFLILSMWLRSLLTVNDRFTIAAISTLVMNGSFLIIAVVLFPWLDAFAHGYGATLGAILMFVFLIYVIKKNQLFHFRLTFHRSEKVWRTFMMMVPIMLGGATLHIYFLLHRVFAAWLDEGIITALNHTSKLVQMPQSILMTAVTTVIMPVLSRKVAEREDRLIANIFARGLHLLALAMIPLSIFLYFYAEPTVQAVFQYGQFTEASTAMAVPLLQVFVIGMFFHAANVYITRFYYAYERSIYPLIVSLISVLGLNVLLNIALIGPLGATGLAWGTTISAGFNFLLLLLGLKGVIEWGRKPLRKAMWVKLGKFTSLTIIITVGLALFTSVFFPANPFVALLSGGAVLFVLLIALFIALRFPELDFIKDVMKNRK